MAPAGRSSTYLLLLALLAALGGAASSELPPTATEDINHKVNEFRGDREEPATSEQPAAAATTEATTSGEAPSSEVTTAAAAETASAARECERIVCLNGGTCVVLESGAEKCVCPPEYSGTLCQEKNICALVVADGLTGAEICAKIGRSCIKDDRIFRCECQPDETFVFKTNMGRARHQQQFYAGRMPAERAAGESVTRPPFIYIISNDSANFDYDSDSNGAADAQPEQRRQSRDSLSQWDGFAKDSRPRAPTYAAECRKIDRCLGVRCKHVSEVCREGECQCNRNLGYLRDPLDGLCKLLNPCEMPPQDTPICGEARCVATLDAELYRCVCPLEYVAVWDRSKSKSSTRCVLISDKICQIPLLNKCQHSCRVDEATNSYRCSCLPGYRSGARAGVDDHMCFFDVNFGSLHDYLEPDGDPDGDLDAAALELDQLRRSARDDDFEFELQSVQTVGQKVAELEQRTPRDLTDKIIPYDSAEDSAGGGRRNARRIAQEHGDMAGYLIRRVSRADARDKAAPPVAGRQPDEYLQNVGMSAQERCNMYCEENKICVLESGSTDSYRCVCDRQGYVSVGDRCLDWCTAAKFSHQVMHMLDLVCYSGECLAASARPGESAGARRSQELAELERASSWRPEFVCDCTTSPLLHQDPATKLCKLDFGALIDPCLPGNEGYVDCVENKNAYCAVLHEHPAVFRRSLQRQRPAPIEPQHRDARGPNPAAGAKAKAAAEKPYVCVCSPEKKFLVDKPRQKAICVDECDLLKNECGRFNRMCRAATIDRDDYGKRNLVQLYKDGPRMNFKRTGCECLPGFNVGPTESVYVTLDDNSDPMNPTLPTIDSHAPSPEGAADDEDEAGGVKYININSRCLLDYDVIEFNATFKAPADFDPRWIRIRNARPVASGAKQPPPPDANRTLDARAAPSSASWRAAEDPTGEAARGETASKAQAADAHRSEYLRTPSYMSVDMSELHRHLVFVSQCDPYFATISPEAHQECIIYRYWIVRKLRDHFTDWRQVITEHLNKTFELMDGDIRFRVNKCAATIKRISVKSPLVESANGPVEAVRYQQSVDADQEATFDPIDPYTTLDADIDCELTVHAARDASKPHYLRQVNLVRQLPKYIYTDQERDFGPDYYLMSPSILLQRETFDNLSYHHGQFLPCERPYAYCDKETRCTMKDPVNFTCTCLYGYTPIGSRDIYLGDSNKEVCEDIDECLFDVCKKLENVSTCVNEIGDYKCLCNRHYTGDNKRFCHHVCNTIPCRHGKCRLVADHYAFCECEEGYKEADCSVQDPSAALRKANMIICGSIFTSALLLAITWAISLNSQLRKTKKKLKRLEAASEAANLFDLAHQQPFKRPRLSKVSVCS